MNLSEFYNAESNTATGPMKALPRKNLIAAEAPLMSFIHLRYSDMFVVSQSDNTNPAPEQSLLTIMAIAIAKSQAQITQQPNSHHKSNKNKMIGEADVHEFGEINECCPHHKHEDEQEEKTDLVPEQFQRKVRSIVGFIPLLSSSFKKKQQQFFNKINSSKSLPQSPQPRIFVDQQEEEKRETEFEKNELSENETNLLVVANAINENKDNISNDEPNFNTTIMATTSSSPPSQEEFMTHWNNTIGKSFLRNTINAVPMLPEVWVLIPFDTLVERFLFQYNNNNQQHRSSDVENKNSGARCTSNNKLEEDFALLVLKSSPSLRQRIVSHLIGQLRELPVSSVAVSCRIAVNVLSSSSSSSLLQSSSSFPKIIKDLEIEHEYFSVKSWLKGCNVEISASCESGDIFWIYGSPHPSYGIVNSLQELLVNNNNNQKKVLGEAKEGDETKVKAEIKNEDEDGEKQLQELLEDEEAQMNNNDDDDDDYQKGEETRFSQPTTTSKNSQRQTNEKRRPVRRQRANSGAESEQLPNLEKNEDDKNSLALVKSEDEADEEVIEPRSQFFPFSFIHILNSRLFSASTINAVNNCNYCQDELIDRLSYKHTTIHLMRIAIPTLMSYGLNVKWIDNNYFHSLLLLSRNFQDQHHQLTSSSSSVARKIILIGSVLKWLKQVFVLSQHTQDDGSANNGKNNCKIKKEVNDQHLWISLRILLFELDDDDEGDENKNRGPIQTSLKLSCSSTGIGAKRWLAQFGDEDSKTFQLEPHQLRVNIDERKFVMTMYLSLVNERVKKCVVVDI